MLGLRTRLTRLEGPSCRRGGSISEIGRVFLLTRFEGTSGGVIRAGGVLKGESGLRLSPGSFNCVHGGTFDRVWYRLEETDGVKGVVTTLAFTTAGEVSFPAGEVVGEGVNNCKCGEALSEPSRNDDGPGVDGPWSTANGVSKPYTRFV